MFELDDPESVFQLNDSAHCGHCHLEAIIEHIIYFYSFLSFTSSPAPGRSFAFTAGILGGECPFLP